MNGTLLLGALVSCSGVTAPARALPACEVRRVLHPEAVQHVITDRGVLRLARQHGQGADGRVVLEAEEGLKLNIAAHGVIGPFAPTGHDTIGTDPSAGSGRFVAFTPLARWERALWTIRAVRPAMLACWYRLQVTQPGTYTFTSQMDAGPAATQTVTVAKGAVRPGWHWHTGGTHRLAAGVNTLSVNAQNGARVDQIALVPQGVTPPQGQHLLPTYAHRPATGTAVTHAIRLAPDETPLRLDVDVDPGGGRAAWAVSADSGTTWQGVPPGGRVGVAAHARVLRFRCTLTESPAGTTPFVRRAALVVSRAPSPPQLAPIRAPFAFQTKGLPLVPATWKGLRWRDGAWTLARTLRPDSAGRIWMDVADADALDLVPACRSWLGKVAGSRAGTALRQGMWNRNLIGFDLHVPKPGTYDTWLRVRLADVTIHPKYHPSVMTQVDRGPTKKVAIHKLGKAYPGAAWRRREWVWLPGGKVELAQGVCTFRVRAGLDFCWFDRVCLVPAGGTAPAGVGPRPSRVSVPQAEATFQTLAGAARDAVRRVTTQGQGAVIDWRCTTDGGKTWRPLSDGRLAGPTRSGSHLTIRCLIRARDKGMPARVTGWQAELADHGATFVQLANAEQRILFDPASGALAGWWADPVGWIVAPGGAQRLFQIGGLSKPLEPSASTLVRRTMGTYEGVRRLVVEHRLLGGDVRATMTVELPTQGLARWNLYVDNRSQVQLYGLDFPMISGVRLGSRPQANRCVSVDGLTGEASGALFGPLPGCFNPTSGLYPGWTSMGWYALYGPGRLGTFTIQTRNPDAYHIWMSQKPDRAAVAMAYRFYRMLVIEPGLTGESTFAAGWHTGDWHGSAERYRRWFRSWMPENRDPKALRHINGWCDPGVMVASRYMTHGWPRMQWMNARFSQLWARAADGTISCTTFPFVNPRLGTAADFRRAHARSRAKGWFHTYYWNYRGWDDAFALSPYIGPTPRTLLPAAIRLRAPGFTDRFAHRDHRGQTQRHGLGPTFHTTDTGRTMCSASDGWNDMLVDGMAHNYGCVLGADGVYLDQTGLGGAFCCNASHGHGQQRAIGQLGNKRALERTIATARQQNPHFAVAIEGNTDQLMAFASFGLWCSNPFWDGNVFAYTFPESKLVRGHSNGGGMDIPFGRYARYLSLFLCANLFGQHLDHREFYTYRRRIGDWMHDGVFQDDVGLTVDRPGIEARWFKRMTDRHVGALVNVHNEQRLAGATLRLRWPALQGVNRSFAYLWGGELRALPVRWQAGAAVVAIPPVPACSILWVAKAPPAERLRAHVRWPIEAGPDKLVLHVANTTPQDVDATMSCRVPSGIRADHMPARVRVAALGVARVEIPIRGVATLAARAEARIRLVAGTASVERACVLAPPLVNGAFEIDSTGHGTPDMWAATGNPRLIHLLQCKKLPPSVHDANQVIHYADGRLDTTGPAEGRRCLRLDGQVMLPWTWCLKPASKVRDRPFHFETGQQMILKPGTRYRLSMQYKYAGPAGELAISAEVCQWPVPEKPAFEARPVARRGSPGRWQAVRLEFTTPADLAGFPTLAIVNKSAHAAWLDDVRVAELPKP